MSESIDVNEVKTPVATKPRKFKNHNELTKELLISLTPDERAEAVGQVLKPFCDQLMRMVKESEAMSHLILLQNTVVNRMALIKFQQTIREGEEKLALYVQLWLQSTQSVGMQLSGASRLVIDSLRRANNSSMCLEVIDEHREKFYAEFIELLTPVAEKNPKLAEWIDPKKRKEVLKNGLASTLVLYKNLGRVESLDWFIEHYGLGYEFTAREAAGPVVAPAPVAAPGGAAV